MFMMMMKKRKIQGTAITSASPASKQVREEIYTDILKTCKFSSSQLLSVYLLSVRTLLP